jgi:hypothetical protein
MAIVNIEISRSSGTPNTSLPPDTAGTLPRNRASVGTPSTAGPRHRWLRQDRRLWRLPRPGAGRGRGSGVARRSANARQFPLAPTDAHVASGSSCLFEAGEVYLGGIMRSGSDARNEAAYCSSTRAAAYGYEAAGSPKPTAG